jgi:hypothetical protein
VPQPASSFLQGCDHTLGAPAADPTDEDLFRQASVTAVRRLRLWRGSLALRSSTLIGHGFKTEVDCGYAVIELGGRTYLHLETYGSSDRKIPGKVSQTPQLDAERAAELRRMIERAFPNV